MRFFSWNVNGIRAVENKGLYQTIDKLNADFFCLQEIKAMKEQLSEKLITYNDYNAFFYSAQKKGYSGLATYSKKKPIQVIYGIGIEKFDNEARVLTLEFEDFYLVNCYFPNSQHELKRLDYKLEFNDAILNFLKSFGEKKTLLICGDFNVAHNEIDLKNPKQNMFNPGFCQQERQWMDKILQSGFIDTFRYFSQEPDQYTWRSYRSDARQRNIGWRIDYFLIDEKSKNLLKSAKIEPQFLGSDHCPITLELTFPQ